MRILNWPLVGTLVVFSCYGGPSRAQQTKPPSWVGSWASAPVGMEDGPDWRPSEDVTLREIVHLSTGGNRVRVRLTNEFGIDPLTISAAHIALSAGGAAIQPGSDRVLTFGGQSSVQIPAGAILLSDPVALKAPPLSNLAVSLYVPSQYIDTLTFHDDAGQTNYSVQGNAVASATLTDATKLTSWYFFDGVDVVASVSKNSAIVALGDSITDGAHSSTDMNRRWTDVLAQRLQADTATSHIAVLNEGIGGNRILHDGYGPNALSRFDRDVLSQSGVRYLIVLEGTNDIGHLFKPPINAVDALQLETALSQMAERAHNAKIKIYGATMLPFAGAGYYTLRGERIREAVNEWIRTSGTFDGVIDFDRATRDPKRSTRFLPQYDSGDHLHPNDAGYKAMGDAVDLNFFLKE